MYAGLISAMPRAGGDYVWMTRIFHSSIGFIIAAVGWWFILWLWTPIYADMGVQTTVKPIFRILGLNGAADWLSSRTGIFVASLVVIAIASILVAVGMKTYANFQKWAMWIGLAGVLVCGILLLSRPATFKEKFNEPPTSTTATRHVQPPEVQTRRYSSTTTTDLPSRRGRDYPTRSRRSRRSAGTGMPTSTFAGGLSWATWTLIPFMVFWMPVAELGRDAVRRGPRRQGLPQEHLPDGSAACSCRPPSPSPSWAR